MNVVVRRVLLGILLLGLVGAEVELLFLKHTDGAWQILPLVLIGVALLVLAVHAAVPGPWTIRAMQAVMGVFVLSGVAGILLHYRGNVEFELERMASLSGLELIKSALMGATPALAPGTMIQLGLVGLLFTYQHPASRPHGAGTTINEVSS